MHILCLPCVRGGAERQRGGGVVTAQWDQHDNPSVSASRCQLPLHKGAISGAAAPRFPLHKGAFQYRVAFSDKSRSVAPTALRRSQHRFVAHILPHAAEAQGQGRGRSSPGRDQSERVYKIYVLVKFFSFQRHQHRFPPGAILLKSLPDQRLPCARGGGRRSAALGGVVTIPQSALRADSSLYTREP